MEVVMFLRHPDSLLDLAHLDRAERDRRLERLAGVAAIRHNRSTRSGYRPFRLMLARLLRAVADRLQPEVGQPARA
jgi:hypothetical protein